MSPRISKRNTAITLIFVCLSAVFAISLLTRGRNLQSGELLPRTHQMLNNHVTVHFVTPRGRQVKTYYWATSHATGRGSDVTDIFNSDIIEAGSGINNHIPLNYTFDQTDLRNIRTLKNVRLGDSVNLIVTKLPRDEQPSGLQRIYKWLVTN